MIARAHSAKRNDLVSRSRSCSRSSVTIGNALPWAGIAGRAVFGSVPDLDLAYKAGTAVVIRLALFGGRNTGWFWGWRRFRRGDYRRCSGGSKYDWLNRTADGSGILLDNRTKVLRQYTLRHSVVEPLAVHISGYTSLCSDTRVDRRDIIHWLPFAKITGRVQVLHIVIHGRDRRSVTRTEFLSKGLSNRAHTGLTRSTVVWVHILYGFLQVSARPVLSIHIEGFRRVGEVSPRNTAGNITADIAVSGLESFSLWVLGNCTLHEEGQCQKSESAI